MINASICAMSIAYCAECRMHAAQTIDGMLRTNSKFNSLIFLRLRDVCCLLRLSFFKMGHTFRLAMMPLFFAGILNKCFSFEMHSRAVKHMPATMKCAPIRCTSWAHPCQMDTSRWLIAFIGILRLLLWMFCTAVQCSDDDFARNHIENSNKTFKRDNQKIDEQWSAFYVVKIHIRMAPTTITCNEMRILSVENVDKEIFGGDNQLTLMFGFLPLHF